MPRSKPPSTLPAPGEAALCYPIGQSRSLPLKTPKSHFLVLKHLFEEALKDFDADNMPNAAVGYEESAVWKKLFDFQHEAAIAIINNLEKYNGCILADSVGLGKTFTALAVIRYYELRNKNVLVLCPKKLEANWNVYNKPTYENNPFAVGKDGRECRDLICRYRPRSECVPVSARERIRRLSLIS